MIGWLSGVVLVRDLSVPSLMLNVGGVGYELFVDAQTLASVPADGEVATLWVHTYVKEENLALYGFTSLEARTMFRLLLTTPRVGPKVAIAALGGFALDELVQILTERDVKRLQRVQGIGGKMAAQIMVSVSDRTAKLFGGVERSGGAPEATRGAAGDVAQETLVAWGFKPKEVARAVAKVEGEGELPLEELLRRAAQLMTAGD